MKESDIRKYAKLMQELDLTGLEITENDTKVRLERGGSVIAPVAPVHPVNIPAAPAAVSADAPADYISVTSPMVGVFYAAPAENADPYVKVGDTVKQGSTLCIIETMKLINEIPAEQDCTIAQICVQNGQVVDYGCELFRVRRA